MMSFSGSTVEPSKAAPPQAAPMSGERRGRPGHLATGVSVDADIPHRSGLRAWIENIEATWLGVTSPLRPGKGGLLLSVRVTPRSSRDEVSGLHTASDGTVSLAVKVTGWPDGPPVAEMSKTLPYELPPGGVNEMVCEPMIVVTNPNDADGPSLVSPTTLVIVTEPWYEPAWA